MKGLKVALVVVLLLGGAGVLLWPTLERAHRADRCADVLLSAQGKKDERHLAEMVPSASVRQRIAQAQRFELVYVRPTSDGSQVGYALARSSTAAKAELLRLFLEVRDEGCRFLQDEEGGAFSPEKTGLSSGGE